MFLSPLWQDGITLFLGIVVEALPFLLLGVLLSGLISAFASERQLLRWLPQQAWLQSLAGGVLGFFFPVCECGNVAVARRLILKGMPPHVAISFLLAAPVFNPVVIVATWVAFRFQPEIVVYRVVLSLAIATVVGWMFSAQQELEPILQPSLLEQVRRNRAIERSESSASLLSGGTFVLGAKGNVRTAESVYAAAIAVPPLVGGRQRWRQLIDLWAAELRELGGILVLGAAIAAVLQTAVPRQWLLTYGQDPVSSIAVMLLLGALVSICSTVDSFFALAFVSTFTPGAILAFLVFGPMIDLKGIGLMLTAFKPRAIAYLCLLIAQFTFTAALLVNYYGS